MKITTEINNEIINFLKNEKLECSINIDIISINRTSMCNHYLTNGMDENDSYQIILMLIKEKFEYEKYRIMFSGKTDDDYFLTIYLN